MYNLAINYLGKLKVSIVILSLIVVFNVFDIYSDLIEGSSFSHVMEESLMVVAFVLIIAYLGKTLLETTREFETVKEELKNIRQLHAKQTETMKRARKDYSEVIQQQFDEWELSKSEIETGFLLLKGLSLKEIASVRDVKEKTARQQASNIYAKAGVAGRHEFAGWFFEDL